MYSLFLCIAAGVCLFCWLPRGWRDAVFAAIGYVTLNPLCWLWVRVMDRTRRVNSLSARFVKPPSPGPFCFSG
jgi:hypothetical protein